MSRWQFQLEKHRGDDMILVLPPEFWAMRIDARAGSRLRTDGSLAPASPGKESACPEYCNTLTGEPRRHTRNCRESCRSRHSFIILNKKLFCCDCRALFWHCLLFFYYKMDLVLRLLIEYETGGNIQIVKFWINTLSKLKKE